MHHFTEKAMALHSSTLAWKIPWTEEPACPWGRYKSDTAEWLHFHSLLSCTGEGNGNPLQCSCRENPRDGGASCLWGCTESDTPEATWQQQQQHLKGHSAAKFLWPETSSHQFSIKLGFPGGSDGKESACNAGSIPGLGGSPGEGNGYPLPYSWDFPGGSDGDYLLGLPGIIFYFFSHQSTFVPANSIHLSIPLTINFSLWFSRWVSQNPRGRRHLRGHVMQSYFCSGP